MTYKLATRAAYYLGEDATGRNEVFEKIQSFYKIRSRIVHGRKQPKKTELKKAFDEVFKLARRTLLKTLKIGRLEMENGIKLLCLGLVKEIFLTTYHLG